MELGQGIPSRIGALWLAHPQVGEAELLLKQGKVPSAQVSTSERRSGDCGQGLGRAGSLGWAAGLLLPRQGLDGSAGWWLQDIKASALGSGRGLQ